ncbi:hypothetical protein ACIGN6_24675 [Streptomyces sp. NPDC053792]|uniref:hypothetical protein n=1 Tax=unclassified Streptomyces TaxID=2593676 RepID=UPI00342F2FD0
MSRTRRGPLRTPFRGLPLAAAVLMAAAAIAAAAGARPGRERRRGQSDRPEPGRGPHRPARQRNDGLRFESVKIIDEGWAIRDVAVSLGGSTTYAY